MTTMEATDIKITAAIDAHRPDTCKFTLDRPVHEGFAYFKDRASAQGSPLAEGLFGLEEVTGVRVSGKDVTVTKQGSEAWRPAAVKIAAVLRAHLASGKPAVSKDYAATLMSDAEMKAKIEDIFAVQVNPALASHGGSVALLDVKQNKVYLKMQGGCQGCGMAAVTLRQGIEGAIRNQVPQVDEILDVTDHASGTNPYYSNEPHGGGCH